jgi:predicted nuclease with TOPRIM domain
MSETFILMLGGLIGGVITAAGQYLIARLNSRTRNERSADLSQKYLSIADITADQLEERINLIGKLDNRIGELVQENRRMTLEVSELQAKRLERTEQMEALEAHVSSLQAQINIDAADRADLRGKLSTLEAKYRSMWQWLLSLLELMKRHEIAPTDPPDALKSDPEISKIMVEIKKGKTT